MHSTITHGSCSRHNCRCICVDDTPLGATLCADLVIGSNPAGHYKICIRGIYLSDLNMSYIKILLFANSNLSV